ncbi:MAG TPA: S1 RNA-binding domain-containing protein, partial [Sporolactobacillaceae bacterium]|nr:S1 RNA-binding domain-containing protein [Sporolactobacillaceae bacterium]
SFVKDINEHLHVGDTVKVKILKIDEESGKISLSIRQTEPAPERKPAPARRPSGGSSSSSSSSFKKQQSDDKPGFNTLEQKLKDWLKESNEKQAQLNKRLKK